jgi:hypothetical protein
MFKDLRDKIAFSGMTVLGIGVALLVVTFFSAYAFLASDLSPISTQDLVQTFGNALGPLVAAAIKVMYLGIMGWISSLITIRGVTIMTHAPKAQVETAESNQAVLQKTMPKSQRKKAKQERTAKPEVTQTEPEMMVIPPEELEQQVQTRQKSRSKS